ncbi:hypothetical protein Gpo141_00013637 [Globisporangium polare]
MVGTRARASGTKWCGSSWTVVRQLANSGAVIYAKRSVEASILITLGGDAELEEWDLHAQGWCCVLVPGYGFGWVQASSVAQTRERIPEAPTTSSLKHLDVPPGFSIDDALDSAVLAAIFDFALPPERRVVYLPPVMIECGGGRMRMEMCTPVLQYR